MYGSVVEGEVRGAASGLWLEGRLCDMLTVMLAGELGLGELGLGLGLMLGVSSCTATLRKEEVERPHLGCGWKGGCAACCQ